MGIEVHVTRQFTVNGKHYRSLEEVPPEFRESIRGRLASVPDSVRVQGEIVVNGKRDDDEKAMPESVREMYDVAMQCIGSGPGSPAGKPLARPKPIVPHGSTSRWFMRGSLLLCLFVCLLMWLLPR